MLSFFQEHQVKDNLETMLTRACPFHFSCNMLLASFSLFLEVHPSFLLENLFLTSSNCKIFTGQIELFSHVPVLRNFVDHLKSKNFNVCAVYLLDSQVCIRFRTLPPLIVYSLLCTVLIVSCFICISSSRMSQSL